ncbi:MAG: activating signal cointegrator 1 complex subunit, partial [Marteilia pararefringens]
SVHEFSEIPVRHQDDHYNSLIYEKVPLKVKNLNMLLESTKVFMLLQGCFSRVTWPVHDYETDLRIVLEQSDRILEAMLIIALTKKFLETSITIVNLIQCIAQRCWLDNSMMLNFEKLINTNLLNIPLRNLIDSCHGNTSRYFMISEDVILHLFHQLLAFHYFSNMNNFYMRAWYKIYYLYSSKYF